jgi:HD-like signal output (HDOD) protein/CheY-like chemotaxis protein
MINGTKQILFVSEPLRNHRFEAALATLSDRWTVWVAASATEALSRIQKARFDAVVTDARLADMEGLRLLDLIQQNHPQTHRFILADLADAKTAAKATDSPHQCLPKPIDTGTLRKTLEQVFSLKVWLSNPAVRNLLGQMTIVPSPPDLYLTIVRALRDPGTALQDVSKRAAQDPGITAKLLQLANSAALGLGHKVLNVDEAIGYLGLEMTRSLVLLAHAFAYCNRSREFGGRIDRLWKHSFQTGLIARRLAREENSTPDQADESFLAGLLHDIGELLFMVNLPKEYQGVLTNAAEKEIPLWQAEINQFGATHAELGAELMAIWNLPVHVVEALALHHHPTKLLSSHFGPLTAVHVADVLEQEISKHNDDRSSLDLQYLQDLGLAERLEIWRTAAQDQTLELH